MNPAVASMLLEQFGSEEAFFRASERHLLSLAKGRPMAMFSDSYRAAQLEKARREEEYVIGKNIRTIYFADTEEYPARLGQCPDAPLMLYTLGADVLSSRHMLAIVGTRHATPYGVNFVGRLVAELAE